MACAIDVRLAGPRLSRTFHLVVVRPTRCSKNCFMHAVWPKRDILYLICPSVRGAARCAYFLHPVINGTPTKVPRQHLDTFSSHRKETHDQ
jgi:hypothetical protein